METFNRNDCNFLHESKGVIEQYEQFRDSKLALGQWAESHALCPLSCITFETSLTEPSLEYTISHTCKANAIT